MSPSLAPQADRPEPQPSAALSDSLQALAERGVVKRFRKGQRLIEEGEQGDTLFIILSGRVRVFGTAGRDDREITYGTCESGEFIGELSFDGGPRSASVEAIEACECVVVTKQSVLEHIRHCPEFALDLLTAVIRRARAATSSAKQLALSDVYGRLAALLNELAQPEADGTRRLSGRWTHRDFAARLGCSREMVSRLLKDLASGGYVQPDRGSYRLRGNLPERW